MRRLPGIDGGVGRQHEMNVCGNRRVLRQDPEITSIRSAP
jgi:hypothetical protein